MKLVPCSQFGKQGALVCTPSLLLYVGGPACLRVCASTRCLPHLRLSPEGVAAPVPDRPSVPLSAELAPRWATVGPSLPFPSHLGPWGGRKDMSAWSRFHLPRRAPAVAPSKRGPGAAGRGGEVGGTRAQGRAQEAQAQTRPQPVSAVGSRPVSPVPRRLCLRLCLCCSSPRLPGVAEHDAGGHSARHFLELYGRTVWVGQWDASGPAGGQV